MEIVIKSTGLLDSKGVWRGDELIATINDHRKNPERKVQHSTVRDNWNVCWRNGRVDWHGTYREAADNALKGDNACFR